MAAKIKIADFRKAYDGLDYHEDDVPKWLWSKRNKWHEQQ
jgi:hypothetical protein